MNSDLTNLSYWFPKIRDAGLPVPRTEILEMPDNVVMEAYSLFDHAAVPPLVEEWIKKLEAIIDGFGRPVFLRTGHTSGKHDWQNTCYVGPNSNVISNVYAIMEYSEINGMFGELPWQTWVVREMLPIEPVTVCRGFGDMPVTKEFRVFVDGEKVECFHPYWPVKALHQGSAGDLSVETYGKLCSFESEDEEREVLDLASRAGKAVGGRWSVDVLKTKRGWFVTDMAEAEKSYHWEGCSNGR